MDLSKYKSVAIIGPCADDPTCSEGGSIILLLYTYNTYSLFCTGDYNPGPKYMVTVKAAFANKTKLTVNRFNYRFCIND